jgi:hypothetical protein
MSKGSRPLAGLAGLSVTDVGTFIVVIGFFCEAVGFNLHCRSCVRCRSVCRHYPLSLSICPRTRSVASA